MATALKRQLEGLATRTEREITELWRRAQRGLFDDNTFVELAAIVLGRARAQGVVLADLSVGAAVARALDDIAEPVGLGLPDGDIDRLTTSVRAVLDEPIETARTPEELVRSRGLRFQRLGRDAPADALTWALGVAMAERAESVDNRMGWIRSTDIDPCIVCRNLADGVVRSPEVRMKRHRGCMCVPQVVIGGSA